ncbi:MAG: hypothetical protein ChlgKO_08110 [Chlamydiales bacterium]
MSSSQASAFFKKSSPKKSNLNLLPQVNSFSSVFNLSTLSEKEAQEIEKLLLDGAENLSAVEIKRDIARVQNITAEVRSINKQGLILIGKRLTKAREILRKYGDGTSTFSDWLVKAFGSKRTAYNILSYYELHEALPSGAMREKFKLLPLKAAYILASRKGELEQKAQLVESYAGEKPRLMIEKIQKALPLKRGDKRKVSKLHVLEKACLDLKKVKLTQKERVRISELLNQFTN